ncbi:MAG: purine-nucleoside phosphorylase [Lentisphaerota bacterium]
MNYKLLDQAYDTILQRWPAAKPSVGLVCGSGWGTVAESFEIKDSLSYEQIPGLGVPGVAGHAGKLLWAVGAGIETFIFQGRRHHYEGEGWTPIALPIYVLKKLNARMVMLTNAAGGIRSDLYPGSLMILVDHINTIGSNPLIGEHNPVWGPRFPDQSKVYDPGLRVKLEQAAITSGVKIRHGIYLATSGPVYETPAEIRAYRTLGADAVGMSTVPEAQLAFAAGMKVVALSCVSNFASGISASALSHEEVTATTNSVMKDMKKLLAQFWVELKTEIQP